MENQPILAILVWFRVDEHSCYFIMTDSIKSVISSYESDG